MTQRKLADYLVTERFAHYHFTVKGNQPTLHQDLIRYFQNRQAPDFVTVDPADHGRIETRKIWATTALNGYLDFPHVEQAYAIERHSINKKTDKRSYDIAYCITSRPPDETNPQRPLNINRGHWCIENSCHYLDPAATSVISTPRQVVSTLPQPRALPPV
ncbi:MAG: hypothetical protein ACREXM_03050 [Gammaproteobacteria bacterium]